MTKIYKLTVAMTMVACVLVGCTPITQSPTRSSPVTQNTAVMSLYEQAQDERSAGRLESAEAALERAVRIESNNPYLWFELAQVSREKGAADKARSLAQRAQSLARTDAALSRQISRFLSRLD